MNNKETYKYAILLTLIAIFLNTPILNNEFVHWDDPIAYTENTKLQADWNSFEDIKWIFNLEASMRFAPVSWLGYKAIYEISGLSPTGIRIVSLSLHTLNTLLIFYIALILFKIGRSQRPEIWALCLTLLWLLNPLRVEPVAWATALTYLISTSFCLSSIILILKNTSNEVKKDLIASLGLTLSIASYPISYTVPLTIPIWIYLRNMGTQNQYKWKNIFSFILPISLGLVLAFWTTIKRTFYGTQYHTPIKIDEIDILSKLEMIVARWVHFISSCIVPPEEITPAHYPGEALWTWAGTGGFLLILILIVVSVTKGGINKFAGLTLLVAAVASIPVLGLTEEKMLPVDRYSYLLSFFILLTLGLQFSHLQVKNKKVLIYGLATYIGLITIISLKSHKHWDNTEELIANLYNTEIVRKSEYWRTRATTNLAVYYASKGHYLYSLYLAEKVAYNTLPNSHQVSSNLKKILIHMAAKKALKGDNTAIEFLNILHKKNYL